MPAYDSEDFIILGGKAHHRSVIQSKLQPLGWSKEQVGLMYDEEVDQILKSSLRPGSIPLQAEQGIKDNVDLPAPNRVITGPLEQHVQKAQQEQVNGPDVQLTEVNGQEAEQQYRPPRVVRPEPVQEQPAAPVNVSKETPKPSQNWKNLVSILDASKQLALSETGVQTACDLIDNHNLTAALFAYDKATFYTLYGEDASVVSDACEGALVLCIEVHPQVVHIITTTGTVSIENTVRGLSIRK